MRSCRWSAPAGRDRVSRVRTSPHPVRRHRRRRVRICLITDAPSTSCWPRSPRFWRLVTRRGHRSRTGRPGGSGSLARTGPSGRARRRLPPHSPPGLWPSPPAARKQRRPGGHQRLPRDPRAGGCAAGSGATGPARRGGGRRCPGRPGHPPGIVRQFAATRRSVGVRLSLSSQNAEWANQRSSRWWSPCNVKASERRSRRP